MVAIAAACLVVVVATRPRALEDQHHNQELTHLHLLQTMVILAVLVETQVIMPLVPAVVVPVLLELMHQHPILAELVVLENHSQHLHIH